MKNKLLSILFVIIILISASSCVKTEEKNGNISIVTTNFALYDFARAAAGDTANVRMLLAPGSESHDFEATLADIASISSADLFVCVGGESEDWVNDVFSALGNDLPETFYALDEVETFDEETIEGMKSDEKDEKDEEDGAPEVDEHVWTSIGNAITLVDALAEKIAALEPESAETVFENARAYTEKLGEIQKKLLDVTAKSARKTRVVADRFPFRYMVEETGLDYYAAFSGCTSATEPSLSTVNYLIEKINSEKIPAIFVIEFSDRKTASMVADETGCEILTLHSAHNVSKEDFAAGVTYADIMEKNIEALKTALN